MSSLSGVRESGSKVLGEVPDSALAGLMDLYRLIIQEG